LWEPEFMDFKMYYIHLNVLPGLNKNKTKKVYQNYCIDKFPKKNEF